MSAMRHYCVAAFEVLKPLPNTLLSSLCGLMFLAFAAVEETHL